MSTSSKHRKTYRIDAWSNPDAEIFILDGTLSVVRGHVGELHADLPPGIYKVKANRGGTTREQLIELDGRKTVHLYVVDFPAIAPIGPILGNDWQPVENLCRRALSQGIERHRAARTGAKQRALACGILFVAHAKRTSAMASLPLAGLRLLSRERARSGAAVGGADTVAHQVADETWAARWLPADPGTHLLDFKVDGRRVRQAVLVAPKWQTRVFIRRRESDAIAATADARRSDHLDLSIQMARPQANVVYSDHLETVEIARNALESGTPIFVSQRMIDQLLYEKFDNPITGLTGLHLFLEALESRRNESDTGKRRIELDPSVLRKADRIIDVVLTNLRRLLTDNDKSVPLPADLLALMCRAGRLTNGRHPEVFAPPMFWASWNTVRTSAGRDGGVWIDRSLWSNIAFSAPLGPYFAWEPRRTTLKQFLRHSLAGRAQSLKAASEATVPEVFSRFVERGASRSTRSASAARSRNGVRALTPDEMAEALGVPYSVTKSSARR